MGLGDPGGDQSSVPPGKDLVTAEEVGGRSLRAHPEQCEIYTEELSSLLVFDMPHGLC